MPRKKIVVISAVVLAAVVLFSSLFYLSENRLFLSTKGLRTNVIRSDNYNYTTLYWANFTDGDQQVSSLRLYINLGVNNNLRCLTRMLLSSLTPNDSSENRFNGD